MNDESSITYNAKGDAVGFNGLDAVRLFQAAALASGIGLLQKGIKPGRGWTMKAALARASTITGKTYKRSEADKARADLSVWVQTMKAALPHDTRLGS
jgi:hypothetical protein